MGVYLAAEYQDKKLIAEALRGLKDNGISPADFDVFSTEPVEFSKNTLKRPSRMSFIVVSGAIAMFLLGTTFVYYTQHNYPLVTGGMPLFSFWATGVVFYELTMLGAIVTTFIWFLVESGLLSGKRRRAPVPEVEPGALWLRVFCDSGKAGEVNQLLERSGALHVVELGSTA